MSRIAARLNLQKLYGLDEGWLDGAGKAPPTEGLVWLEVSWAAQWPAELPQPHAYPTEAGHVCLEWSLDGYEVGLTVDLAAKSAELQVVAVPAGEANHEQSFDLSAARGWSGLVELMRQSQAQ